MFLKQINNVCTPRCVTPAKILIGGFTFTAICIISAKLSEPTKIAHKSTVIDIEREGNTPLLAKKATSKHAHKIVIYKDFTKCPPRPTYFKEYKAHCWAECITGEKCSAQPTYEDFQKGRARKHCLANLHLIGMRKSGSTDMTKWFDSHPLVRCTQQDFPPQNKCPVEQMAKRMNSKPQIGGYVFNDGPGVLVEVREVKSNKTHMEVTSPMQLLGYMATEETRFYVQLRNPTDRVISNLFHWHKRHYILNQLTHTELTETLVHNLFVEMLSSFELCLAEDAELACVYKYAGEVGGLRVSRVIENLLRHSLYVVYIEEALKFVPREQIMFRTMDEYSKDQIGAVQNLMSFFGLKFQQKSQKLQEEVKNIGKKKPVWDKTIGMLDKFYQPYNRRLAELLDDKKWLFKREL